MIRSFALCSLALLVACGGEGGTEEDDCGVVLANVFPEDGATGVDPDGVTVVVELDPSEGSASVDILDPNGDSVWGNVDTSPIEVELRYGDLEPNTEYTVDIAMAPAAGSLVCGYATTTFTTGPASSR